METQVDHPPLILTLAMDAQSRGFFERLRRTHYPPELNRIPAHLTLFHKLPDTPEVRSAVARAAERPGFRMSVTGLRSLGRGVAFVLESEDLREVHAGLARAFHEHLSRQDLQRFSPHVVVQNKVAPEHARDLLLELQSGFQTFQVEAVGLQLWRYRGGPWDAAALLPFQPVRQEEIRERWDARNGG